MLTKVSIAGAELLESALFKIALSADKKLWMILVKRANVQYNRGVKAFDRKYGTPRLTGASI